jgi:hypothetical protein
MNTIALSDWPSERYLNYAKFYCLVRTLIDRPELAQKIRKLKLNVHNDVAVRLCYLWDDYSDEMKADGRMQDRDELLDKCSDVIQSSSFCSMQKEKWKFDLFKPWTSPLCGIILSLILNLQSLTLLTFEPEQKQDDRQALSPFFGCTLREDKDLELPPRYPSYEQQLGFTGRPDPSGLEDVAGLAKLRTLSLSSQGHITLSSLKNCQA